MSSSSFTLLFQTFVYVNIIIILSLIDSRVIISDLNCSLNKYFCMSLFHYSLFGGSLISLWSLTDPKTKRHSQLLSVCLSASLRQDGPSHCDVTVIVLHEHLSDLSNDPNLKNEPHVTLLAITEPINWPGKCSLTSQEERVIVLQATST